MNGFHDRGSRIYDDEQIFRRNPSQGYAQGDWGPEGRFGFEEEYASEIADFNQASQPTRSEFYSKQTGSMAHVWIGWAAAICAILSLFLWPLVLAPAALVISLFAWAFGNRWTGGMSAMLAGISLLAYWLG